MGLQDPNRLNLKIKLEKIGKYLDLRVETQRLTKIRAIVTTIIIREAGAAVPVDLEHQPETVKLDTVTPSLLQKAALLGTAPIQSMYPN